MIQSLLRGSKRARQPAGKKDSLTHGAQGFLSGRKEARQDGVNSTLLGLEWQLGGEGRWPPPTETRTRQEGEEEAGPALGALLVVQGTVALTAAE